MGKGRGGNAGFGGGMNMKQLQQLQMKAMKMQKEMEDYRFRKERTDGCKDRQRSCGSGRCGNAGRNDHGGCK